MALASIYTNRPIEKNRVQKQNYVCFMTKVILQCSEEIMILSKVVLSQLDIHIDNSVS